MSKMNKRYGKRFSDWDEDESDDVSYKKDKKRYDLKKEQVKEQRYQKTKQKNSFFEPFDI